MCGIIYIYRKDGKSVSKMLAKRYDAQSARGSEGFGLIEVSAAADILGITRETDEKTAIKLIEKATAPVALFHHRYPTSTPNVRESAHPITVSHESLQYDYLVVHNGIVMNDKELRAKHEKQGHKYTTVMRDYLEASGARYFVKEYFNDSEAIAIELAHAIESGAAKLDARGSCAIMALQIDKRTRKALKLFYGRNNGNPLMRDDSRDYIAIASEGSGLEIAADTLYSYEYATGLTDERVLNIGDYIAPRQTSAATGYGYDYDIDRDYDDWEWNEAAKRWENAVTGEPRKATTSRADDRMSEWENIGQDAYYESLLDEEEELKAEIEEAKTDKTPDIEASLFEDLTALQKQIKELEADMFADAAHD